MNPRMNPRRPDRSKKAFTFLVILGLLGEPMSKAYADSTDQVLFQRNEISLEVGNYSLKSPTTTTSSMGALSVGYNHYFTPHFSADIAYQNIMATQGAIRSIISGVDVGVNYCFFSCVTELRSMNGLIQVTERDRFGILLGVGFAERFIQLPEAAANFSGTFERIQGNYFIDQDKKILMEVQNASLVNGVNSITSFTIMLGIGFLLGAPSE